MAKSPANATPSLNYERGWNAINELVRSDSSWSSRERNVFYVNNHDGTFSEASGAIGLDFPDDSRAFALTDLDHDGRLEVILKNRGAPQLRILHNAMENIGNSIAFRLRGKKSNRDAIGAAVTVEAAGHHQTKYLQAGSGFLSQHSKELFFGVGQTREAVRSSIRWPGGLIQTFENLPLNHRIEIVFPVESPSLVQRIRHEILEVYLADDVNAYQARSDGSYHRAPRSETAGGVDSHQRGMTRRGGSRLH